MTFSLFVGPSSSTGYVSSPNTQQLFPLFLLVLILLTVHESKTLVTAKVTMYIQYHSQDLLKNVFFSQNFTDLGSFES